ncbi:MAG: hypothetical protein ACTHZ9_09530 [Leucobacter sp.]
MSTSDQDQPDAPSAPRDSDDSSGSTMGTSAVSNGSAITGNRTKSNNVAALERATSRDWAAWVSVFEAAGALKLSHTEIAKVARDEMPSSVPNPDWWAQGAAIAFEQHAGLRVPGQSHSGTFRVSVSRTVPLGRDAAIEAWATGPGQAAEHLGHTPGEPRHSRTEKRSFWRTQLEGAGRVEVAASPKPTAAGATPKSIVAVNHEGLLNGDSIEAWRAYWKTQLAKL